MKIDAGFNLQDLPYFLALARHGRLVVAADRIGVEHTTVSRRVRALEKALGARLFDKTISGWELTDAGRRFLGHAEQIEATANQALSETRGGEPLTAAGTVRIIATDGFGSRVVTPALARLRRQHPEISIELLTTSHLLGYRVGEFDIAISLHRPDLPRFVSHRLCDYALRLYASADYLDSRAPITQRSDLDDHQLVWYIESLLDLPELRVMDEVTGNPQYALLSTNVFAQVEAVAAGTGIGLLPGFLAANDPRLVPVLPDDVDIRRTQWMLVSRNLAGVQRIQIVCQYLAAAMSTYGDLLIPGEGTVSGVDVADARTASQ